MMIQLADTEEKGGVELEDFISFMKKCGLIKTTEEKSAELSMIREEQAS